MSEPTEKTLQDLYDWSDRLTGNWLDLGERLRRYADAWKADVEELRAEVERLTRLASDWRPIETAPHGPVCLFLIAPKSEEETWADTSGRPIAANGEPHIVMGPYGQWGCLWKATHWMPLPRAPMGAPHCPTCGCSE